MARQASAPSPLLALPEPCLLAVLQCCAANDPCSLFSAARAHSKLREVAAAALFSVKAAVTSQSQVDSALQYLEQHGPCVDSINIKGDGAVFLRQLPPSLQLSSLHLASSYLQLHPAAGFQGVLGAIVGSAALKQLRLTFCTLLDANDAVLKAALLQLPTGLEHLSISALCPVRRMLQFPAVVLQRLQQLTYLELANMPVQGLCDTSPAQQPLQALTRLVDLRLDRLTTDGGAALSVTSSLLSCTQHLTRLEVSESGVDPDVLAGRTQLQHLKLHSCKVYSASEVSQLLSHLQPLQQLTHLDLSDNLQVVAAEGTLPAATYAALTANSKLQHLNLSQCAVSEAVWQHVFPAGKQLPHLRVLDIPHTCHVTTNLPPGHLDPRDVSRIVSCCPGLQSLNLQRLQCRSMHLTPLLGLTGLHTLLVTVGSGMAAESLGAVCELTGLRELALQGYLGSMQGLLQLAQLTQLTTLSYDGWVWEDCCRSFNLKCKFFKKTSGEEHVWRQLLRRCLDRLEPDSPEAQQAAAALAE